MVLSSLFSGPNEHVAATTLRHSPTIREFPGQ